MSENTFNNQEKINQQIGTVNGNNAGNDYNDYSTNVNIEKIELNKYVLNKDEKDPKKRFPLKSLCDGKEHLFTMYYLHDSKFKLNMKKECDRILCLNVHHELMFIADHMHVNIPLDIYYETKHHSIIIVNGIVEEYTRTNGTKDYEITITEVISNRFGIENLTDNMFMMRYIDFTKVEHDKYLDKSNFDIFKTMLKRKSKPELDSMLVTLFSMLDNGLGSSNSLPNSFMSNFIMTQYFLNERLFDLMDHRYFINELNKDVVIDLIKITSWIITRYNNSVWGFDKWLQFFKEVSQVCDFIQGVNLDLLQQYEKNESSKRLANNIKEFKKKCKLENNIGSLIQKIKLRHEDFRFDDSSFEYLDDSLWSSFMTFAYRTGKLI